MTKVMRKEARHTQRWDRASGVPPDILEHFPPKNQSLPTLLHMQRRDRASDTQLFLTNRSVSFI